MDFLIPSTQSCAAAQGLDSASCTISGPPAVAVASAAPCAVALPPASTGALREGEFGGTAPAGVRHAVDNMPATPGGCIRQLLQRILQRIPVAGMSMLSQLAYSRLEVAARNSSLSTGGEGRHAPCLGCFSGAAPTHTCANGHRT